MSSFFTYAERISLQKFLAEGLSFDKLQCMSNQEFEGIEFVEEYS